MTPKWEYRTWTPSRTWNAAMARYVLEVDDGQLVFKTWGEVMCWFGDSGWELVTVTDRPNAIAAGINQLENGSLVLYFKRPKSAAH